MGGVATEIATLKGRALEIYEDIAREIHALPGGYTLPSVRDLQRRYQAGQQTILTVLDELDRQQVIQRFRRKGVRIRPEGATPQSFSPPPGLTFPCRPTAVMPKRTRTTVLRMLATHASIWRPVVDEYNRRYPERQITVAICDTDVELATLPPDDPADFVLFPNNPCLLNARCNTWQFMDLRDMLKTLDRSFFYDGIAVTEPRDRVIGIAPTLGTTLLHCRSEWCTPEMPTAWNWDNFNLYAETLLERHPRLHHACFLDGYIYYLFHAGQSLVHPENGRLRFSYEELALPLERLRRMVAKRTVPIFSDMYEQEAQYELFRQGRLAILEQSSSWQSEDGQRNILRPMPSDGANAVLASEQFSIRATSMRYDNCWEFIKFMLTGEIQSQLAESQGCIPVRRGVFAAHTDNNERMMFDRLLNRSARRPEDFYFPPSIRYILEVGIDKWLKLGGDLKTTLTALEQSCQSQIDEINRPTSWNR